ncbi:hypothetical protein [Kosakonia sp. CFBP8986]|uniref:hypothetical protein n=1 Tax=Kosakonia sp. CFBP8986 TaxID=3096524 RepID=UPI002A69CEC0|nr:hypothetical protein [Kosakonia sp. CFBP8986]MDY0889641.1 hypothetical protein [Kosakonia sp. CFBP8986]
MILFTKCDLQHSHLSSINAAFEDEETLIVERNFNLPMELYISHPNDFYGRWVSTGEVVIAGPVNDILGVSGIRYHKVIDD